MKIQFLSTKHCLKDWGDKMANYDYKRATILIKTTDGREYKYIKPIITLNGTLVGNYYEYAATEDLVDTQAFADFADLKDLIAAAIDWIVFDIDITNGTLNYYNSEEKSSAVSRPRTVASIRKLSISSVDIEEVAINKSFP